MLSTRVVGASARTAACFFRTPMVRRGFSGQNEPVSSGNRFHAESILVGAGTMMLGTAFGLVFTSSLFRDKPDEPSAPAPSDYHSRSVVELLYELRHLSSVGKFDGAADLAHDLVYHVSKAGVDTSDKEKLAQEVEEALSQLSVKDLYFKKTRNTLAEFSRQHLSGETPGDLPSQALLGTLEDLQRNRFELNNVSSYEHEGRIPIFLIESCLDKGLDRLFKVLEIRKTILSPEEKIIAEERVRQELAKISDFIAIFDKRIEVHQWDVVLAREVPLSADCPQPFMRARKRIADFNQTHQETNATEALAEAEKLLLLMDNFSECYNCLSRYDPTNKLDAKSLIEMDSALRYELIRLIETYLRLQPTLSPKEQAFVSCYVADKLSAYTKFIHRFEETHTEKEMAEALLVHVKARLAVEWFKVEVNNMDLTNPPAYKRS